MGDDAACSQWALLTVWILGGVEVKAPREFLEADLRLQLPPKVFADWVAACELGEDETSRFCYKSLRHPAWGRLVGRALDEPGVLQGVADPFRDHLIERLNARAALGSVAHSNHRASPVVCVLAHALISKLVEIDKLSFYCTALYGNAFFIESASTYLDISLLDDLARSDVYLSLYTNARRYNPEVLGSREAILDQASRWLSDAINLREKHFGPIPVRDPKCGWLRYEQGYQAFLICDYVEAQRLFRVSKEAEKALGGRRLWYAAQSCTMEAQSAAYAGMYTEALGLLQEAEELLEQAQQSSPEQPQDSETIQRFQGNLHLSRCYVYLSGWDHERARQEIPKFVRCYKAAGAPDPYAEAALRARVHLQREEWDQAEKEIRYVTDSRISMQGAEMAAEGYRILGDALLGQGRDEEARVVYQRGMPGPGSGHTVDNLSQTMMRKRLEKLAAGSKGAAVLQGEML
jgi:tetratricopeptide (TPR) repeat protein